MSNLDKPDGFSFWWTHRYQSDPTALASETKPENASSDLASEKKLNCLLLDPQAKLEITKSRQKRELTPLELTTTKPDPPPLGHDPVPDFSGPPMPSPPFPDIPLKPPHNPPPDEEPPRTPQEIVPPPQKMPPDI